MFLAHVTSEYCKSEMSCTPSAAPAGTEGTVASRMFSVIGLMSKAAAAGIAAGLRAPVADQPPAQQPRTTHHSPTPTASAAADMHYLISLLLLAPCGCALQGAAGQLVPLRRNAYAVYADSSGEEYEPYAVLPLHSPLPFLQVLSPAPKPRRRPAKRRPAPDSAELYAVDASHVEQAYEPGYSSELYSAELEPQPTKYSKNRDQYDEELVVYARPNRHGGYSYRRPSQHAAPVPSAATPTHYVAPATPTHYAAPATPTHYAAPATSKHYAVHAPRPREPQEPVIIRIHKYRVIH